MERADRGLWGDRRHRRRHHDIAEADIELRLNTRGIQGCAEPDTNTLVLSSLRYAFSFDARGIENKTVIRLDMPCANFRCDCRHCLDVVANPAEKIDIHSWTKQGRVPCSQHEGTLENELVRILGLGEPVQNRSIAKY